MFSLMYVSQALLRPEEADEAVADIVQVSTARNASLDVTGALLFTGDRFAQWLEGEESAVLELMSRIRRDVRHTGIIMLQQGPANRRRFANWSLAYHGRSTYAAATVERAADEGADIAVGKLTRLLEELTRLPQRPPTAG